MNFFVISDTHGHLEKTYDIFEKLKNLTTDGEPIDMILHCGDYKRDGISIGEKLGIPSISVEGNCDGSRARDFKIVNSPAGNILVTHGHMEGVNYDVSTALYLAEENHCVALCYGHTHIPHFENYNGIYLINPGSITSPRDGTEGSCALINATEKGIDGGIYYYHNFFQNTKRKKNSGGFLRGIVNYSDRF